MDYFSKINSIIIVTMLRFKKNCDYCHEEMDSFDAMCPNCHEPNHDKAAYNCRNMAMYPAWLQGLFFLLGFFGLYAISKFVRLFSTTAAQINFTSYIILFIIFMLLLISRFVPILKSFKNWKGLLFGVVGFIAIYAFDLVNISIANLVVKLIFHADSSTNTNQESIESVLSVSPFMSLIIFGIIGPVCEEITYRVGLFSFLRRINIVLAYVVTIIFFASIHFTFGTVFAFIQSQSSENALALTKELLSFPSYLFAGGVFTFLYHKFGFASSITAHALGNFSGLLLQVIRGLLEKIPE